MQHRSVLVCLAILALTAISTVQSEALVIAPFCDDYAYKLYDMCGSKFNCSITSLSAICVCPPSSPYSVVECVRRGHGAVGGGGTITGLSWNRVLPDWQEKSHYLAPFVPGTKINLQTSYAVGGICDQDYQLRMTQDAISKYLTSGSTGWKTVNITVDPLIFTPDIRTPVLELSPYTSPGNPFCMPSLLEIAGHFRN